MNQADPLTFELVRAVRKVAHPIPETARVIVESSVGQDEIEHEIQNVDKALNSQRSQFVTEFPNDPLG
jgi:hypothetical protein